MRRWLDTGTARYLGLDKMDTQYLIKAMTYNLCRFPWIAIF